MKPQSRKFTAKLAAAVLVAGTGVAAAFAPAAFAAGVSAGPAIITNASGSAPLNSGGSATVWAFRLPPQAHCTKDTATNAYHVFTYIVDSTIDPATLTFTSSGPSAGNPLYDSSGHTPQIALNTAPTSGQVIGLPTFDWSLFSPDGVAGIVNPNGVYNVGIACATNLGQGDVFWNVQIAFTASASDPNGQVWNVVPVATTPESPWTSALPLSAVVVLGLGAFVMWRRRSHGDAAVAA